MKMCFISAPTANDFIDETLIEDDAIKAIAEHAPLGILSLAAVMEQRGVTPDIIDLNRLYYAWIHSDGRKLHGISFSHYVFDYFGDKEYDIFGFSTICSSYPLTLRIAQEIKSKYPTSAIILGGPQASVVDVATMETYAEIDFIVRGEAEESLPNLIETLNAGGDLSQIQGITYREHGKVIRNGSTPILKSLDILPFPAYHLYPYASACQSIPLELGRGCPFACTFCSTNDFFRRSFRLKKPEHIIGEMKRVHETYGISNFDLVHDMFTVDRKRVVAFCEALLASGEKFCWGCSARTDCIDEELVALMAEAGCGGIFFGIETGSQRLQRLLKKNLDLEESARIIKITDKHKIKTAVSLITGFPDESIDDLRDTVGFFMDSMRYDSADPQLCLLAPLAATPIEAEHRDELIFDDIISDMSFQGWEQDPEDRIMIAAHREIFCNFYSVPTPYLDRQFLKELREFLLNGMSRFRWLLVGLHQDVGHIVDLVAKWRSWRRETKGGDSPAAYYASPQFHAEFLEFLRKDYLAVAKAPAVVSGLLDYAADFDPNVEEIREVDCAHAEIKDFGGMIRMDVTPVVSPDVRITAVQSDYRRIIEALRSKSPLDRIDVGSSATLATADCDFGAKVLQLSRHSTELLTLCDGSSTVADIGEKYRLLHQEVEGVPAKLACLVGIELLRRQGLVMLISNLTPACARPSPGEDRHCDKASESDRHNVSRC
jgi:radical SAM superfamily enzyme YgiQ (UPF0313 family)